MYKLFVGEIFPFEIHSTNFKVSGRTKKQIHKTERRSFLNSLSMIEVTTERIRLKSNAHQNPATVMP